MVTIFELFSLIFMIGVPVLTGNFVAKYFNVWAGIVTGIFAAVLCVTAVILLYRARGRRHEQHCRELREKYRGIYRVIAIPTGERHINDLQGVEISAGDYCWEAEPPKDKGSLIYLQGLNDKWQVIWYAGFSPEQVEYVALKPCSQYDWDYSWLRTPPPCPFPVQAQKTTSMGLPNVWGRNGAKRK